MFRKLMDMLVDEHDIKSATTHNWEDKIEIKAESGDGIVTVTVKFEEVNEDGN